MRTRRLSGLTLATVLLAVAGALLPAAVAADRPPRAITRVCPLPAAGGKLPPRAVRGLAHHLDQYPTLSVATSRQRSAAGRLLAEISAATSLWRDPRRAAAAGFAMKPARNRRPGAVGILHAEHRRYSHDGRYLVARRPESLIYANVPGRPLRLVGVMFSMPRGMQGRSPGGPITRWHWHQVCVRGAKRGLKPLPDGSCPAGARLRQGSEMMHVWFTRELRSAFAIHAPEPELCAAGLFPRSGCR